MLVEVTVAVFVGVFVGVLVGVLVGVIVGVVVGLPEGVLVVVLFFGGLFPLLIASYLPVSTSLYSHLTVPPAARCFEIFLYALL